MRAPLVVLLLATCLAACTPEPTFEDDAGRAANEIAVIAVPRGSTWRYWDRGGDLGAAWRGTHDDSTWAAGAGPLGYGESYLHTTLGYGPSSTSKHVTTYFRRRFTVADPAAITAITGEVMFDDGIVVYLNGTRIGRDSMPAGPYTASTLAAGHEAGNTYRTYDWTAQRGLLVAGENVIAVEVHQASAASSDLVFDLALALERAPVPVEFEDVRRNASWWFWDEGGDPGADWRTVPYGGAGWDFGSGAFGYGEGYLATTTSSGPDPAARPITTYFRTTLYLTNPSAVTSMLGEVMYDDGFVAYLNGVEIGRASMPPGPVGPATQAIGHEAGGAYQTFDWTAMRGALRIGTNVLAVEVHQASPASSDLVFDMALRLRGEEPPPPSHDEDIARGAPWRYWDRAGEPSAFDGWVEPDYNDAVWAEGAGPLGYGESYLATTTSFGADPTAKPITTYFRKSFTVAAPSVQTTLIGELMYDDGVVVHLNGHEIARLHMPAGSIEHTTRSTGHETGDRYERYDWSEFNAYLLPGRNVIAVEVHQAAPTSSDLTFDLALAIDTPAVCAIPGGGPAIPPPPSAALEGVWVGPTATWTVGARGAIGRRADPGGAWCWSAPVPDARWRAVWGADDDDVWLVGDGGRVVRYDGAGFAAVDLGAITTLSGVWGSGPDDVWVVGDAGVVRHFDGASWTARGLPADQTLQAVWGASAADVWVTGHEPAPYPGDPTYDGTAAVIYRWVPASASWTLELRSTRYYGFADLGGLQGTSATNVWAVGADHPAGAACAQSQALHRDGTGWTRAAIPSDLDGCRDFRDVAVGAPGATGGAWVVGGGERGALRFDGTTWSPGDEPITIGLASIDHRGSRMFAAGFAWAGGGRHTILRWDGTAWVRDW